MTDNWDFSINKASEAVWTEGLREIFEYRDLGIKGATQGDYIAHIVKANGKEMKDEVQHWHVHDCTFQFVMVLNGWAEFEYEGEGVRRIEKGDCINQRPGIPHREIACSKDYEVLEIVAPANFETRIVEALQIHRWKELAVLYCTAHLLTLDTENAAAHDGGSGVVDSEALGPKKVSYVTQASAEDTARAAFFSTTSYGRRFLALEEATPRARFGAMVV